MYISGLAHVLSISGYHMAVVAGVVFFMLRALLALVPALAIRRPIKKWAALAALAAATFYLLLSGAEVATQRSFIMIAIVLIGVMVDRPTLTLRTLDGRGARRAAARARGGGASELPDVVCRHPGARRGLPGRPAVAARRRRHVARGPGGAVGRARGGQPDLSRRCWRGFATTPYAAFHFHRAAPYGVIANLLAMPIVSVG